MRRLIRFMTMAVIVVSILVLSRTPVTYAATEGTQNVWCDIRGAKPADQAYCNVYIDHQLQPETIAPGKKGSYKLASGDHVVEVYFGGVAPWEWSPDSGVFKTVKVSAGYTRSLYATFLRKGFITLTLNQPNAIADFYVDGTLAASLTNSAQIHMIPAKMHLIEVRNIKDPTLIGDESWKETKLSTYVSPGAVRTIKFNLQKQTGKGYLKLTCNIKNAPDNESLFCQPFIDGVSVEQIPQNASVTYTLTPGTHSYRVDVGPRSGMWVLPTASTNYNTPSIRPGVTTPLTTSPTLTICQYPWTVYPDNFMCPSAPAITTNAAIQYFERGMMLWEQDLGWYSVLFTTPGVNSPVRALSDPLDPKRDTSGSVGTPPPGMYAPTSGFGILWRGDFNDVSWNFRDSLGWALAPETGYQMTRQCGSIAVSYKTHAMCYLTLPDGQLITFTFWYYWRWGFVD